MPFSEDELAMLEIKLQGLWIAQNYYKLEIDHWDFIEFLKEFGMDDREQIYAVAEEYGYYEPDDEEEEEEKEEPKPKKRKVVIVKKKK